MSHKINWHAVLECTDRGPRSTIANAVTVLQHDPVWSTIIYDEFLDAILITSDHDRAWRDDDDTRLCVYLQQSIGMSTVTESHAASAVRYVARQRTRHCVRDYLAPLVWDTTPRIACAFGAYWGMTPDETHPLEYLQSASHNFFVGLAARVMAPGCKLDTMPVFEGPQGIKKSTALELLVTPAWFAAMSDTMGTKDSLIGLRGKWLVEISELQSFSRAEVTQIKNAMSTRIDTYRPPYGRAARDYPRQCVFAGTTNRDDWATDDTGARRFWPLRCGGIDLVALARDRDQLFAEAVTKYRQAPDWWTMPSITATVQASRHAEDAIADRIRDVLLDAAETTIPRVCDLLKLPIERQDKAVQMRIGSALRLMGWTRTLARRDGKPSRVWLSPVTTETTESF